MKYNDILQALRRKQAGIPKFFSNESDCFIHSVETSCSPVAHSNKAAKNARGKYLALWSYFGRPALFHIHTLQLMFFFNTIVHNKYKASFET